MKKLFLKMLNVLYNLPFLRNLCIKFKLKGVSESIQPGIFKFSGKSTLCERFAKSKTALKTASAIELANSDPRSALLGATPHLIDEWQKAPEIWNLIKDDLDDDYRFGKYIITGSTTPIDPSKIQHSGAGRIAPMMLRPFSLFESRESTGEISLSDLFDKNYNINPVYEYDNKIGLADIAHLICRGGWPISVLAEKDYAIKVTRNYYNGLFTVENENDDFAAFLKNKDIELLKVILKSFAIFCKYGTNSDNLIFFSLFLP